MGDKEKRHHDKNISDNRVSITVVRVGSAAGTPGPVVFIAQGVKVNPMLSQQNLVERYGLPEGSIVICNKNSYMDDVTWKKVVKFLCFGIRRMPVICLYPLWNVGCSLDGFKSHVNVTSALEEFASNKIRIVKEEAATSHINQAYDQLQAKEDKKVTRALLDMARSHIKGKIDQWTLIGILCVALKYISNDVWVK